MPDSPRRALVLGSAACLHDDVAALERIYGRPWDGTVVAVNRAGLLWDGPIHHWVSLHPAELVEWVRQRPGDYETWAHSHHGGVDHLTNNEWGEAWVDAWGGSSGMLGARVAFGLGFDRIVLAGVPLEPGRHAHEHAKWPDGWPQNEADIYWKQLVRSWQKYEGRVRSMSGRTAKLFGRPTPTWLQSHLNHARAAA